MKDKAPGDDQVTVGMIRAAGNVGRGVGGEHSAETLEHTSTGMGGLHAPGHRLPPAQEGRQKGAEELENSVVDQCGGATAGKSDIGEDAATWRETQHLWGQPVWLQEAPFHAGASHGGANSGRHGELSTTGAKGGCGSDFGLLA